MRCSRLCSRGCVVALVSTVAALAFAAGPVGARSLDAAGTTIVAFADTHQPSVSTASPFVLTMLRQRYCRGSGERGRPLSLNAALTVAKSLVASDSHGRGLQAFSRSRDGRSESRAIAAAAGALGAAKPAAALAALLRARQLAPADPVPLIDAAPLLSQAGKGRAALALLDAAKGLKATTATPFGTSWSALIAANRGQALIVTRQYAQAEKALAAALRAAPLLREAKQNMAVAYDCQGDTEQAKRYLFAAVRRQSFSHGDFIINPPPPPPGEKLDPVTVLDTSKGQTLTLQTLHFPQTMDEGVGLRFAYQGIADSLVAQLTALVNQEMSDQLALNGLLQRATPATRQRTDEILSAAKGVAGEPDIAALQREAAKFFDQMSRLQSTGMGGGESEACLDGSLHGTWLQALEAYDQAQRRYAVAEYRLETALAANLGNGLAHKLAMLDAQESANTNFHLIVGEAQGLATYDMVCDPNPPPPVENPLSGQSQTPPSDPCPKGITGPGFELQLLVFALAVHCEELEVRASTPTWLAPFASFTHNFGNGSNTIFAGAQAGHTWKVGPFVGAGASGRAGVYVTFGADGSVQDVGLRAKSSVGAQVGVWEGKGVGAGGKVTIPGPETTISFAGAFTSPI